MSTERRQFIKDLADREKVSAVAQRLGMQVLYRQSGQPKALCPFHDDHTPSLALYENQYHCFSCNAHGNVYELIKAVRGVDFVDALRWLADQYGEKLSPSTYSDNRERVPRERGLDLAFQQYKDQNAADRDCLHSWASTRGFNHGFLNSVEVFGATGNKLSRHFNPSKDLEELDSLEEAGLIYKFKSNLPLTHAYHDIYSADRIIFTIRTPRGEIAGFAGRAVGDDQPKYLFSKGLPKGELLYRLNVIRDRMMATPRPRLAKTAHLYVVEGLMDALRLESLGLSAVAILGSKITKAQTELLADLASDLDRRNQHLAVHIFMDADEAGKRGAAAATPLLWRAAQKSLFSIDVIYPKPHIDDTVHDPDEYLRYCSVEEASSFLRNSAVSCLSFLVAQNLNCQPEEIDTKWKSLLQTEVLSCLRNIDRLGDYDFWEFTFLRLYPSSISFGVANKDEAECLSVIEDFLRSRPPAVKSHSAQETAELARRQAASGKERISHALQLATSSAQRRDLPVDEGTWLRINLAGDVFEEHFRIMLKLGASHEEPFTAARVPKQRGEFRLKALPCHEDLVLQQYIMNALLGDYPQTPRFLDVLPATRYNRYDRHNGARTTGLHHQLPEGVENIVSFAYQLDMDVLEGRMPPGNSGMFRHYSECWQEFIAYLDSKVTQFGVRDLHVARLDIRSYYDQLPLFAVRDALFQPLEQALISLGDASQCAPEFLPEVTEPTERAKQIVDWLCKQSFGYKYFDPADGSTQYYAWKDRGVPQGPDLSAYLANIALFSLDCSVTKLIDKVNSSAQTEEGQSIRATYGRYVDDLILITDSAALMSELRSLIEGELSKLGLELNKKTSPLPSMTQADVRQWLTDERGGLGVSAPSHAPTVDFETLVNDCIESGHVDRQDSLLMLHSLGLDDPDTPTEDVIEAVKASRRSNELRFGDLCSAAKHIWRVVAEKTTDGSSMDDMAKQYFELWRATTPSLITFDEERQAFDDVTAILAALDGVERFLGGRVDRNPAFSSSARQKNHVWRKRLAQAVTSSSLQSLTTVAGQRGADFAEKHLHTIELKKLSLLRTACNVLYDCGDSLTHISCPYPETLPLTPPIMRHRCSVAVDCRDNSILDEARMRCDGPSGPILFLHNAIARFQIGDMYNNTDPQEGIRGTFDLSRNAFSMLPASRCAFEVVDLWLPNKDAEHRLVDRSFLAPALRSFINIAPKNRIAEYLARRPEFNRKLLDGAEPFPTPPGIDYPGILGWNSLKAVFVRVDFKDDIAFDAPDDTKWETFDLDGFGETNQWRRLKADATGWIPLKEVLPDVANICANSNAPNFCASLFLGLYEAQQSDKQNIIPCAAPHILVKDFNRETLTFSAITLLGYHLCKDSFVNLAFIRRGSSLAQESIAATYSDVWRIGVTVADITKFLDYCHADSSMRLTKQPFVYSSGDTVGWARETLIRTALYRLQGRSVRPGIIQVDASSNLPLPAARAVKHLQGFPSQLSDATIDHLQLRYVLSSSGESRAMALRMTSDMIYGGPGGAPFFLMHFASHYFREDEVLAELLPHPEKKEPHLLPKRRAVLGSHELARRVECLLREEDASKWSAIQALSAGLWILSLTENIKAQVLERLFLLSADDFLRFKDSLGLEPFGVDSQSILIAAEIECHQSELLKRVIDLKRGVPLTSAGLDKITPLGWWALLLIFCGFSDVPFSKAAASSKILNMDLRSECEKLTIALLLWDEESKDFPWEGLLSACTQWTGDFVQEAFDTLAKLDNILGVVLESKEESMFTYNPNYRKGIIEFSLPTERCTLASWQFLFSTTGSAIRDVESARDATDAGKKVSFWTETRVDGRLVAISAMSNALAALAGLGRHRPEQTVEAKPIHQSKVDTVTDDKTGVRQTDGNQVPPPGSEDEPLITSPSGDNEQKKSPITPILFELDKLQKRAWKSRGKREDNFARIALFQMDVDTSYRHPVIELCPQASLRMAAETGLAHPDLDGAIKEVLVDPTKWTRDFSDKLIGLTPSCAEYRRQAILKKVLQACGDFGVDILLLPEYSVRPETIEYLVRELPITAPDLSVWAGTYRLPPHLDGRPSDQIVAWNAELPVVLAKPGKKHIVHIRKKKYPAQGLNEIFRPDNSPLKPVTEQTLGTDRKFYGNALDFVTELICSELFMIASPSNLYSMAHAHRELLLKFGLDAGSGVEDVATEVIQQDLSYFAKYTSLHPPRGFKRHPIVLVPAMTTRATDYAVVGQAGFLAAGLTTVFCNAVAAESQGHSCFIGTDSWDMDDSFPPGMPQGGPYHGVFPGIYRQNAVDRGWLGKKEQALVIADIDPLFSFGGKPRPEGLLKSLKLIAHLPILENWKINPRPSENDACRCSRSMRSDIKDILIDLHKRLDDIKRTGTQDTINDDNPAILAKLLVKLANWSDPSGLTWLHKRANAYKMWHAGDPLAWPPPVALDWIWVDLGNPTDPLNLPVLSMPPFSGAPEDNPQVSS